MKKAMLQQKVTTQRAVAGGREVTLTFREENGHPIPALLMLPSQSAPAVPGVVMLHGYSSRKEDLAGPAGIPLLEHGIASLSIDLPLHGTRADPIQRQSARNPLALMKLWKQALADARLAIRYLAARPEVDRSRLALLGYSMGAYLSVAIAPDEPLIRAVVLAAGGDLPTDTPFASVARTVADPLRAVHRLDGRPLLMVHGRHDRTILPDQARRLFDAAPEPKEIRWYDAGHYLPTTATAEVAEWIGRQMTDAGV